MGSDEVLHCLLVCTLGVEPKLPTASPMQTLRCVSKGSGTDFACLAATRWELSIDNLIEITQDRWNTVVDSKIHQFCTQDHLSLF